MMCGIESMMQAARFDTDNTKQAQFKASYFAADLQLFAMCFMLVTSRVPPAPAGDAPEVLDAAEPVDALEDEVLPVICTS